MDTTEGCTGVACLACESTFSAEATYGRCPDCNGALELTYTEEALARAHEALDTAGGIAAYADALPFDSTTFPTLAEGDTPLIQCPTLESGTDLGAVWLKDEGRNGTGGVTDREMAVAVAAAVQAGAGEVALPTTGNAGQSAAAYAARAGLESTSFVPSRANFANKAMINVHGGEMSVVGGRYSDAAEAFESASTEEGWFSLAPFDTPFRHEGAKTLAYELVRDLGSAPDAVVHPTSHGVTFLGLFRGFRELEATGAIETAPRLYAVQPAGCAPIVSAFEAGERELRPVEHPDSISGPLEVPAPAGGRYVLDAIETTDGGAVAVDDDDLLDAGMDLAGAGVPVSATGGAAVAGLDALATRDAFDADEQVVLLNPVTVNREADLLRSRLMSRGV